MTELKQRKINHVAFVIDESGSMEHLAREVVKVFDAQVRWLAELSRDMDQETRVSLYTLTGTTVTCVLYDQDVLRLPSLAGNYTPRNGTPLVQAVAKAVEDLKLTPELYGDHGFLLFVLTDGDENTSHVPGESQYMMASERVRVKANYLRGILGGLGENWTIGCLVPDFRGKMLAEQFGFSKGNIAIWDASSAQGLNDAGEEIKAATSSYFTQRAAGVRGTNTLFAQNVSAAQVASSGLAPVDPANFMIVPVALASTSTLPVVIPKKSITKKNPNGIKHVEIMPFIEETGRRYVAGSTFYELVKSEKFDPHKEVVLIHRQTKQVYKGEQCKKLLGLGSTSTRVRPQPVRGGDYDVFIQSTSVNRHLPIGSRVLIFK
jgi:hypothetical protein